MWDIKVAVPLKIHKWEDKHQRPQTETTKKEPKNGKICFCQNGQVTDLQTDTLIRSVIFVQSSTKLLQSVHDHTAATVECYSQDMVMPTEHTTWPVTPPTTQRHESSCKRTELAVVLTDTWRAACDSSVWGYRRPTPDPPPPRAVNSNCTNSGTWSDGICGCGQPWTWFSSNHDQSGGPSTPSGRMKSRP